MRKIDSRVHALTSTLLFVVAALACCGVSLSQPKDRIETFKRIELSKEYYGEGVGVGDINRDGHMDVIAGPFWFAGPNFTQHEYYTPKSFDPLKYGDNFLIFVHDFNRDQWPDILVCGFPGKDASWYENPRGRPGHWQRRIAFDGVDNESPAFGDLNNDDRPELIFHHKGVLGYAGPDRIDATKRWIFHPISEPGKWSRFNHGLGFGDINGDGRKEILMKEGWWEQPASLAGDPVWKRHDFKFGDEGGSQMHVYDVDGDTDADVIASLNAHGYGLAWFEQIQQNGSITFREHLILPRAANQHGVSFTQLHAVELADMDGDGLKDIVTGKRHLAHGLKRDPEAGATPVLYWFKLSRDKGGRVSFIPHLIDDASGVGTQIATGDLDGDKQMDVAICNKKGIFVLLQCETVKNKNRMKRKS